MYKVGNNTYSYLRLQGGINNTTYLKHLACNTFLRADKIILVPDAAERIERTQWMVDKINPLFEIKNNFSFSKIYAVELSLIYRYLSIYLSI